VKSRWKSSRHALHIVFHELFTSSLFLLLASFPPAFLILILVVLGNENMATGQTDNWKRDKKTGIVYFIILLI
jgi:hypothetical protein